MGRSSRFGQKALTPVQQGYFVTLSFPGFKMLRTRGWLHCVGVLQPTPTSDRYTIDIEYEAPTRPKVLVTHPALRLAQGKKRLPHVFDGSELCLYTSPEWRPDLKIAEFIMPWISLWLYFYEVWLITGEWLGGGHEPTVNKK